MNINIPSHLKKVRTKTLSEVELINFEDRVKTIYEKGKIKSPVHLTRGNEKQLIEIFNYVHPNDWVFSSWRNHYHALLHGIPEDHLFEMIVRGNSMSTNFLKPKFYSSSIVGGIIPIALGVASGLKRKKSKRRAWCFIGDMTFETGVFHEVYKYATNFELPLQFVVEDNNMSTNTPTDKTWGKKSKVAKDIIYYKYTRGFPHHGTGNWVLF